MFGNVTALVGWIYVGKMQGRKACSTHAPGMRPGSLTGYEPWHVARMLQA